MAPSGRSRRPIPLRARRERPHHSRPPAPRPQAEDRDDPRRGPRQAHAPITSTIPKPLVEIRGKALIDYGLDALARNGVERVVVNVHYMADLMRAHLRKRRDMEVLVSDESDKLLESGGGIVRALPLIGDDPFLPHQFRHVLDRRLPRRNLDLLADLWNPADAT